MKTKHGQSGTPTPVYTIWKNLRRNHPDLDPRWAEFPAFAAWATPRHKPGLWLTKRDASRPHGPGNSTFGKPGHPDGLGRKRIALVAFGATKSLAAWSRDRRCKVSYAVLRTRVRDGVSGEDALAASPKRTKKSPAATQKAVVK